MAIEILRHESSVLRGNACRDPHVRDLWVYLPPGYETSGRRYPVLWCLTGFTGTGAAACVGNRWSPGLPERLDRLVAEGCPPVLVAFPDCFTRWGGSQYRNSSAVGRYEDYLCEELIPFVDARYRTVARPEGRGVFGKSSGGYGALRLAMVRPGTFGAVACHSGDMGFEFCYVPDFASCIARLAEAGSLAQWVEAFEAREKKSPADHATVNIVAMAAAYSPDPDKPYGIGLPFDLETGAILRHVWRRWKEQDPVEMVANEDCAEALRMLRLLFLDCGSADEYRLHLGLRLFRRRLDELGIPHEAEEFADDHRSLSYRYEVSVPRLARALQADPG